MTYKPEENMTPKAAKKEAERQAVLFEDKVIKRRIWRQNNETCRLYKQYMVYRVYERKKSFNNLSLSNINKTYNRTIRTFTIRQD